MSKLEDYNNEKIIEAIGLTKESELFEMVYSIARERNIYNKDELLKLIKQEHNNLYEEIVSVLKNE